MRKWILATISILFLLSNASWANNSDFTNSQKVIENWFVAMKEGNVTKASEFLAPQFVSVHTDGIVRNKEQEIQLMQNLQMKSFNLTDFKFSQSGNIITVTYKDQGTENIDNKAIDGKPALRMAVLQKQDDHWVIIAYANLDRITQ